MKTIALALMLFAAPVVSHATVPFGIDPEQSLSRLTWLVTHNAFANTPGLVPSQDLSIRQQLDAGVRGLMLDIHESRGRVRLCHGFCSGWEPTLASLLDETVVPFLYDDPDAIVSLHLEDYVTRDALRDELARVDGLAALSFDPDAWQTDDWPTYRALRDAGQRLLMFTQSNANEGALGTSQGPVHVMYDRDYTVENYWSLGESIFSHDNACISRWSFPRLDAQHVGAFGKSWSPLFVMNHFHGVALGNHSWTDNAYDTLRQRIDERCLPAARRNPNMVAVDFFEAGQARSLVASLNAGTLELFDGISGKGQRLCAIPAVGPRDMALSTEGGDRCPPGRARSAVLRDVPAGTTYVLSDGKDGSAPRLRIMASEDLAGRRAVIHNLEDGQAYGGVIADRENGGRLAGRVTHARVEAPR